MKTTTKMILSAAVAIALVGVSCKKKDDDPKPTPTTTTGNPPPNAQEVITTMKVMINDGTTTATYFYKDPDGDGGITGFYGPGTTTASAQTDSVINLLANKNYTVNLLLLDETKNPIDTISNEVLAEAADHMFFFNQQSPSALPSASVTISGTNLTITYKDSDGAATPKPIGLFTEWMTGAMTATKKELNIELKHQPGVKDGTYAPGDVDVAVPFKIKIN
ncbi:MAG: hypothetical protein Q7W45_15815 [Bacteroidota bacterium]|nr:hypothetical protein [Bacteroidota bacterium]MDP3145518.1 hypothetical protein [Bacteroidota bacterium]MDP3556478.1 hypothetical protein [Bacteroidota bacterium]